MKNKDPYLSELDALGELTPDEGPTDLHVEAPPPPEKIGMTEPERLPDEIFKAASDVPVQIVVVLGRKGISMRDLIDLRSGQVIELDRLPQEAVDLVANGKVIAKGELVEIEGKRGVRVLKISA